MAAMAEDGDLYSRDQTDQETEVLDGKHSRRYLLDYNSPDDACTGRH